MNLAQFGQTIKQKYPDYKDVPDEELGQRMLAKYPEYQSRIDQPDAAQPAPVQKGLLERLAGLAEVTGQGALGRGLAAISGPQQGLTESISRGAELNASVPRATIQRLIREGKPLPGVEQVQGPAIPSNREFGASALTTGLTAATPFLPGAAGLAGRVAQGASLGGAQGGLISAASGGNNQEVLKNAALGGVVGGALPVAGAALRATGRGVGKLTSEILGVQTGAGAKPIEQAFKNPNNEGLKQAMRGTVTGDDVLDDARGALYKMKDARGTEYRSQLAKITDNKQMISLDPVKSKIAEQLDNFNITRTKNGLNFDQSKIADAAEATRLKGLIKSVETWKDTSPAGLDLLKQRMDDYYSPSSSVRSFVQSIKGEIKGQLSKNVKGYDKMTSGYRQATEVISEVEKALSLGNKASKDTAIRKLASSLRRNNEFRQQMVEALQNYGSPDLLNKIAGLSLNSIAPRGLIGQGGAGLGVLGSMLAAGTNPGLLPVIMAGIASTSPRLVGEAARLAGKVAPSVASAGVLGGRQVTAPLVGSLLNR